MAAPLFNKKIPHNCEWCLHGKLSEYTDEVFCPKKGITRKSDSCRHYKYDVLKRTPKKNKPSGKFSKEDFEI